MSGLGWRERMLLAEPPSSVTRFDLWRPLSTDKLVADMSRGECGVHAAPRRLMASNIREYGGRANRDKGLRKKEQICELLGSCRSALVLRATNLGVRHAQADFLGGRFGSRALVRSPLARNDLRSATT
jgi:hypothetical protein